MISNEHFLTQIQTDVSQELISLDKQASQHKRATFSQLICLVLLLVSAMGTSAIEPLSQQKNISFELQRFLTDPFQIFLIIVMVVSFAASWLFWARDIKYQELSPQFAKLYKEHADMIKNSAPLTDLTAHFENQMALASHYNILSNIIALAVIAGIVLYQFHPLY
ncbi:hypothetical protein [Secundilactobacillus folii]|uniref:Uncharacterized protein n=1 Tax=Secundilactobacillus folii TaxID=2678357 RepID=A0A7X2XW10_9LACO|nr:hypothetical protein [Secundilactobacillus folii]MTV82580.1 hypothetical protein [Secundilactobacillus folii]